MNAEIEAKAQEIFQRYDLDALDFARWLAERWATKCEERASAMGNLRGHSGVYRSCAIMIRNDLK